MNKDQIINELFSSPIEYRLYDGIHDAANNKIHSDCFTVTDDNFLIYSYSDELSLRYRSRLGLYFDYYSSEYQKEILEYISNYFNMVFTKVDNEHTGKYYDLKKIDNI